MNAPVRTDAVDLCPACGASDWGSRKRCKPCRALQEHARRTIGLVAEREKDRLRRRAWRDANPAAESAASRRRRYGITADAFDTLLRAQGGVCRLCRREGPNCVDHDHDNGRVRGILCSTCNAGLGHFRDDPRLMRAAARYLSSNTLARGGSAPRSG